ncbi:MAG TPA: sigma-70 family RNA polymerase sigma factor [Mucilaginibacter sp.]
MKHLNERALLQLVSAGDENSFTVLYEHYYPGIYAFVRKYLKSDELSDDICQNVFLKIWEHREQLSVVLEFNAYAFTIAKRQSLDFLKRATIEQAAMNLILQSYPAQNNMVEEGHQYFEYMRFIDNVLSKLPTQSQQVFNLCRQQYKSYDEAAQILGISRNAIKKHMVRSMKVLRSAAESELGVSMSILLAFLIR